MKLSSFAPLVLRVGLAVLFLWFGYQQLTDGASWVDWVPAWAMSISGLTAGTIVLMNGILEVIGGTLLILGIQVRTVALILSMHLFVIAVDIGVFSGIGMRDFALACATLSLGLSGTSNWTIDSRMV